MAANPHKQLIEAINRLAEFTQRNLPPGYMITLNFTNEEASIALLDPEDNEIEDIASDLGYSGFIALCDEAQRHAALNNS